MTRSHKFSWFNPKTPKKIYLEIGGERFEFEEDSNPKKLFDLLWNNATYYQVPILISRTKVKD